jgi:hypothetical protein
MVMEMRGKATPDRHRNLASRDDNVKNGSGTDVPLPFLFPGSPADPREWIRKECTDMRFPLLAVLAIAFMALGCGSQRTYVRPGAGPPDLEKERILILPCEVGNFEPEGFKDEDLNKAVTAGIRDVLKPAGRHLEPARAFFKAAELDGMARRLTSAVFLHMETHEGSENAFDLDDPQAPASVRALPPDLDRLVQLAGRKFHFPFQPRFVFGLVLDGHGPVPSKITLQYRVSAALYDLRAGTVHSCTTFTGYDMGREAGDALVRAEELGRETAKALLEAAGEASPITPEDSGGATVPGGEPHGETAPGEVPEGPDEPDDAPDDAGAGPPDGGTGQD